jgi:predicted phosphodiesterase
LNLARSSRKEGAMRLGIVTDVHVSPPGSPPAAWHNPYDLEGAPRRLALALARLRDEGVEAIAVLGDLTNRADAASVARALEVLAGAGLPIRIVPGNHDAEPGGVDLARAVAALDSAQVRTAAPDGELLGGTRLAGVGIGYDAAADRWQVGGIEAAGWDSDPVVLLSHSPLLDIEPKVAAAGLKNAGTFADPTGVGPALADRTGPSIVLHGHFHVRDAATRGPILQLGFAALVEPPNEVAVLDLDRGGGELAVRIRRLPIEPVPAERLPVLVPPTQAWRFAGGAWREEVTPA